MAQSVPGMKHRSRPQLLKGMSQARAKTTAKHRVTAVLLSTAGHSSRLSTPQHPPF